jgi:conjugal transfer pilus assembly protein TraW
MARQGISTQRQCMVLLCGVLFLASHLANAKDLGVQGAVFPIEETSLLEIIHERLVAWQKTGELRHQVNALKKRLEDDLRHLPRVEKLTPAPETRLRFFNPSVTVTRVLTDEAGMVLALPGQIINPLDSVALSSPLVFIDPNRQEEWQWLDNETRGLKNTAMIIVVGGDILHAMHRLGRRVYYDKDGVLAKRLSLTHTPTVITQDTHVLRLEEIKR